MIKKQLAFIQDWIGHDNVYPLLSHIITYLDPKSAAQFLRCNKQLYYKPVLPLIWTQFITTDTYTPHHLVLWKTLAIDRFHRDTPCEEDKERLHSLLIEEKPALALQNDYQKLVTEYNTSLRLYRDLQEKPRTLTLDNSQQTKLVTLYRLHKQHFSCSDKDIFPEKAVSLMQASTIDLDDLNTHIQNYINTNLQTEKETLIERLDEKPETNEAKAAHTQDITTRLTDHPLLVFATVTDGYYKGWTPLHVAAFWEKLETVEALITAGANMEAKDNYGYTPLHWAAFKGHTDIVQALLTAGADVNATINNGWAKGQTPLMRAASYGRTEIVQVLLEAGADVNTTDNKGWTPLDLAKNDAIKALLRAAGAKNPSCCTIM